ncbi:MAG: bifunctional phosphoribosylaminoimidazolecarboxamide formyltransferase/IMP cyclohydrolase [Endomicrobium sp.]|jgi:phosphoribosylaminoimidazolecarboxamide formyltransferase/IMP cyclohydrolase|nr:bifunctional phosphoribosylaminoimidazolecarboxamide formyltransferase/IMP cyclohydrolase [Endomicrobium sp.]
MLTALISVSDKTGIIGFARELKSLGWNLVASSGTSNLLNQTGIKCKEISVLVNSPEILDGRVKTLNPKIYAGILAVRDNKSHMEQLLASQITLIDMVVVDLYPFETITSKIQKPINKQIDQKVIENIDIGGVSLLRAAAKNYRDVIVLCSHCDYINVIKMLKSDTISEEIKLQLAAKAFGYTSYYDSLISNYFTYDSIFNLNKLTIPIKKLSKLRYGENPHQKATLYSHPTNHNKYFKQIHGKELSYNNYLDLESAYNLVNEFDKPSCAIVKHNNPCGCASGKDPKDAYLKALLCDPLSSFGGIIAFNTSVDKDTAIELNKLFVECIIAPNYTNTAIKILSTKKNVRLLIRENDSSITDNVHYEYKITDYGLLIQDKDNELMSEMKIATEKPPTDIEMCSLIFALTVAKYVKSNAIVLAVGEQTIGIGAGQMSRIDSLKIATYKMRAIKMNLEKNLLPIILASDGFFPFPDVVALAHKIGVTAIIQPGGSIKDNDSIQEAQKHNMAMVITGMRHFKH